MPICSQPVIFHGPPWILLPGARRALPNFHEECDDMCKAPLIPGNAHAITHRPVHKMTDLILASGSEIRAELLKRAGLEIEVEPARVDEEAIKRALLSENVSPRDIADNLAEAKARKISARHPDMLVFGCDQVLEFEGALLSKAADQVQALGQLKSLRGKMHVLYSAAVACEDARPVWRHVGQAQIGRAHV